MNQFLVPYYMDTVQAKDMKIENQLTVVTIPGNFPPSDLEKSILIKGLHVIPSAKKAEKFLVKLLYCRC